MPVLTDIALLAACRSAGGQAAIHAVPEAALAWQGDTVRWVGPEAELPGAFAGEERQSAGGRLVIPGLVDCHTHLAFGGWRAGEFAQRIEGADYLAIARAGGGIAGTMRHTRAASEEALADRAAGFLEEMRRLGVTTVEAKSGYGLTAEDELKTLRVYRRLAERQPTRIVPTLLGAHIVPPEFARDREGYLRLLTDAVIPQAAADGLARFCDVFVEETAFSRDEARAVLAAGARHGLRPKLHADQLSDTGGAALAAEVGAVSADHLEHVSEAGVAALAEAGVVAVSLPLATLYLGVRPLPARALIEAGVAVAVATDFNPGSAPSYHLPLAMMLACTVQRMTPAEALKGATVIASKAVGLEATVGSLEPGKRADFALIDAPDVNHWLYHFRPNACVRTVIGGETVWERGGRRQSVTGDERRRLVPPGVPAPGTAEDDPRLGRWLARHSSAESARVALVGFPSDEGVRRNGGRPGAAAGPAAIRRALYALTPDAEQPGAFTDLLDRTADLGDVPVTGDVEADQQTLGDTLAPLLAAGIVPVVLGGGHETSFGHFLGYVGAGRDVEILNWDAHADVRPLKDGLAHSGSPFRQALEHASGRCTRYQVAGLQPHSTARAHLDVIDDHGGEVVWRRSLSEVRVRSIATGLAAPTLATFDLDAVDAASAPGVSAPNVGGLPAGLWLYAAYELGRSPLVGSFDVVELNPAFDADGRTARLAALTVWHVLKGLAERG